ncbi:MAG: two-component regulator propeller domain-containing protein, partial [Pseudomonadota bacterium]
MLLVLSASTLGQELALAPDAPFRVYSVAEGLNQKTILALAQDHNGYLWVGTFGGLNRFDGKSFESLTTRQGLRRNMIQALTVDSQNRLWAGDNAGGLTLIEDGRVVRTFDPQKYTQG